MTHHVISIQLSWKLQLLWQLHYTTRTSTALKWNRQNSLKLVSCWLFCHLSCSWYQVNASSLFKAETVDFEFQLRLSKMTSHFYSIHHLNQRSARNISVDYFSFLTWKRRFHKKPVIPQLLLKLAMSSGFDWIMHSISDRKWFHFL